MIQCVLFYEFMGIQIVSNSIKHRTHLCFRFQSGHNDFTCMKYSNMHRQPAVDEHGRKEFRFVAEFMITISCESNALT